MFPNFPSSRLQFTSHKCPREALSCSRVLDLEVVFGFLLSDSLRQLLLKRPEFLQEKYKFLDLDLVSMYPERTWMSYCLTRVGQEVGERTLSSLSDRAQGFIIEVSDFVRRLSFTQLVSAIYNIYPEMRANSVFQ